MVKLTINKEDYLFVGEEDELLLLIRGLRKVVTAKSHYLDGRNTYTPQAQVALTIEDIPTSDVLRPDSDKDYEARIKEAESSAQDRQRWWLQEKKRADELQAKLTQMQNCPGQIRPEDEKEE